MATRNGSAEWRGSLQEGTGQITIGNGVYTGNFSFESRFEEGEQGTNPEELISAALAGCFSMQLGGLLGRKGHEPQEIRTTARAQLRNVDGAPTITQIEVETEARVPGIEEAAFREIAEEAKRTCVISRALAGVDEITLEARLAT